MRGLTEDEVAHLKLVLLPSEVRPFCEDDAKNPWRPMREQLERRGLVTVGEIRNRFAPGGFCIGSTITHLGRLALQCHIAATTLTIGIR